MPEQPYKGVNKPRKGAKIQLPPQYKGDIAASMARAVQKHEAEREAKVAAGGDPRGPTLLEQRDPAMVAKVLDALVHGQDKRRVAREHGVNVHTIRDIYHRHIELIGGWKNYAIERATETRERLYAAMNEKLDQLQDNPEMLAKERTVDIAKSIEAMDKTILACNGITQGVTVNVVQQGPSVEDVMKMQEELRRKLQEKQANSIPV